MSEARPMIVLPRRLAVLALAGAMCVPAATGAAAAPEPSPNATSPGGSPVPASAVTPASAASPAMPEDAKLTAEAKNAFAALRAGNVDQLSLAPSVSRKLGGLLPRLSMQLRRLGDPKWTYARGRQESGYVTQIYRLAYPDFALAFGFGRDAQGVVQTLFIQPDEP